MLKDLFICNISVGSGFMSCRLGDADSDYLSHDYDNDEDGILRAQKYFQENDLVDRKIKAFHMTLDNVDTS